MQTNKYLTTTNRVNTNQGFVLLLILGLGSTLLGCSANLVTAGKDGIRIRGGEWTGKSDEGTFTMQFSIGTNGESIFLLAYAYPCGREIAHVFMTQSIKTPLANSAFEMTIDDPEGNLDISPRLVITGTFIDSKHAEGDWEMSGFQNIYADITCPPVRGSWKGVPD
jgi:hypothetical protein